MQCNQEKIIDREGNAQFSGPFYVISLKIFLDQNRLKLIGSWFPERSANVYSVLSRENSAVVFTIFGVVCFEAVARGLDDVSNDRLKCADVSGIRRPFNYNL